MSIPLVFLCFLFTLLRISFTTSNFDLEQTNSCSFVYWLLVEETKDCTTNVIWFVFHHKKRDLINLSMFLSKCNFHVIDCMLTCGILLGAPTSMVDVYCLSEVWAICNAKCASTSQAPKDLLSSLSLLAAPLQFSIHILSIPSITSNFYPWAYRACLGFYCLVGLVI